MTENNNNYESDNEIVDVKLTRKDYKTLQKFLELDPDLFANEQLKIRSLSWLGKWFRAVSIIVGASLGMWLALGDQIIGWIRG